MFYFVLSVHILLCVVLIGLVLIQQGKGADMGAAFGGGSSNTVFGAGGATQFITKLTTGVAVAFMVTSIILINLYTVHARSGGGPVAATAVDPVKELMGATAPQAQQASPEAAAPGAEAANPAPAAPQPAPEEPKSPEGK